MRELEVPVLPCGWNLERSPGIGARVVSVAAALQPLPAMNRTALLLLLLTGCGGTESPVATDTPDAAVITPDATDALAERQAAASETATMNPKCAAIGDFYWEIGDGTQMLGHGAVGTTYARDTEIPIASASKIVFGAYVVELAQGNLTANQKSALRMLSGYHGLNPVKCSATPTVAACLNAGSPGPNYTYDAAEVGRFHYDGAHDQMFAVDGLGLGTLSAAQLTTLVVDELGIAPGFVLGSPLPSGGIRSSAAQFAIFLRAIVHGDLRLRDHLGADAVCTLPGPSCPTAASSPSPLAWHYSYNHWVEDDANGDGAFSSPGAFGFYPWISADKTLYGVLSRQSTAGAGGFSSAGCGQAIRRAWVTATVQL